MQEPVVIPPPPAPAPSKPATWVIILIVVVVLCCCVIGIIGIFVAFGEDLLSELGIGSLLPLINLI